MGRKKVKTAEKTDIRLRLDDDLAEELRQAADEDRVPVAALIRSLVVRELKRRREAGQ